MIIEKNGNEAAVPTLGARLRLGREARGLTLEEAGRRLHLPHQVVRRIENDEFAGLGAPVFVRGYLKSYARLVDIRDADIESCVPDMESPPLVATGAMPMSRRLFDRYARQSLYVVLTAVTVVPVIVLGLGGHLGGRDARIEALDAPTMVPVVKSLEVGSVNGESDVLVHQGPPAREMPHDVDKRTVMASLLPAARSPSAASEPRAEPAQLHLRLDERSWVEVNLVGGERLEFGMLPAGSERSYPLRGEAQVSIGNAAGASVIVNGEVIDLTPIRRANVARFRVSSDGSVQPLVGG
jgi:cytoskeleton protein RodZ